MKAKNKDANVVKAKQTIKPNLFTEKQASNKTDNSHTEKEPVVALFSTEGTFISASAVP